MQVVDLGSELRLGPGVVKQKGGKANKRKCLQVGYHYGTLKCNPIGPSGALLKCISE